VSFATKMPGASAGSGDFADALAAAARDLARRIAAGAMLWCVAPDDHHHAEHVAVEFSHPVIMGKRAVPARAVRAEEACTVLRATARPGDVIVLLGAGREPVSGRLLRRARPWGLTSLWVATGGAAHRGLRADHVLVPADDEDGVELVATYHLLWELTHVVFEHPGLLAPDPAGPDEETVCVTCADEGLVAEIAEQSGARATVRVDGRTSVVDTGLVGPVHPGDLVLTHAGVAITRIDEP
jgi:hydrogenase maturation factor